MTTIYDAASISENAIAATILNHVVPRQQTVRTFVAAGVGLIATVVHYIKGGKREKKATKPRRREWNVSEVGPEWI
jgi:hypothetical protein